MLLFPFQEKTLVSSFTKKEVLSKIARRTKLIKGERVPTSPLFNGYFKDGKFRLSLLVRSSQNHLPLVKGEIEDTSRGSIVFLRLTLFPAAKLYLIFFSVLALVIGLIFLLLSHDPYIGVGAFGVGVLNYLILTINFRRRAKETIAALEDLLDT